MNGPAAKRRRCRPQTWLWVLVCGATFGTSVPAFAQTDDENARRHFESGAAYLQQSDYENALREFQSAYALSKRAPLLLNIATVNERMGRLPEAIGALEQYLAVEPQSPERATIETRIANLKKRAESQRDAAPPPPAALPPGTAQPPHTEPPGTGAAPRPAEPAAPPAPAATPATTPAGSTPDRTPAYIALGAGGAAAVGALITGLIA